MADDHIAIWTMLLVLPAVFVGISEFLVYRYNMNDMHSDVQYSEVPTKPVKQNARVMPFRIQL